MTSVPSSKPIEILLVEDNPADVRLTEEVIKQSEHQTNISVAEDGEEAVAFLRREGRHAAAPRPDLILLDIELPGLTGLKLLEMLKSKFYPDRGQCEAGGPSTFL